MRACILTPKTSVHEAVGLKRNCRWKLFDARVLSEINGISAMFLSHILLQIVPVQTEMHTLSTSFRQGVIEDPLNDLAAAPISSTNAAAIFPNIRAQDPVTAHVLQIHTHI